MAESARAAFVAGLRERAPALDPAVRRELEAEAQPVLESLIAAGAENPSDVHEALALAALFGRRVATLGQSPSLALAALDAIVAAVAAAGAPVSSERVAALRSASMEGLAAAVDERARGEMVDRAAQSLVPVIVSPRVLLLVIAGCEDADAIAEALARLGRSALDGDAKACIVHASFAHEPARDVALEIAAFESSAHMIGARAIFSGTPVALHALGTHAEGLCLAGTFEDALRLALEAAEQELRPASLLSRGLKRLRG